jgi:pimeloyl-ACP methyl ester carboxylesterase
MSASLTWTSVTTGRGCTSRVLTGGSGDPLLFLHAAGGLSENDEFLSQLASQFTVFAPEWPGYGESTGETELFDMLDFTLHGWDVVDGLGLGAGAPVRVVGHSMGGMIAAEMACLCPERVTRLALVAPVGLWLDEHPVADIFTALPHELPALLFHDPAVGAAALTGGLDFSDNEALIQFFVGNARRLGTAGKILFPIPNRGLARRLYRLRAPTLLVWGLSDRVVPPVYGPHWQSLVPHAELVAVEAAGHMAPVEQPDEVAGAVGKFLAG